MGKETMINKILLLKLKRGTFLLVQWLRIHLTDWMVGVVWGRMDTCICMAESLHCSTETTTTLLIDYNPI